MTGEVLSYVLILFKYHHVHMPAQYNYKSAVLTRDPKKGRKTRKNTPLTVRVHRKSHLFETKCGTCERNIKWSVNYGTQTVKDFKLKGLILHCPQLMSTVKSSGSVSDSECCTGTDQWHPATLILSVSYS